MIAEHDDDMTEADVTQWRRDIRRATRRRARLGRSAVRWVFGEDDGAPY